MDPFWQPETPTRLQDMRLKQQRVCEYLEDNRLDALILATRENFAWYTSGGDNTLGLGASTCAALFVTAISAVCLTTDAHAQRLADEQLDRLPIEVASLPWGRSLVEALDDRRRGLRTGSDRGLAGSSHESTGLSRLRVDLTQLEKARYRELGRMISHAIEATARHVEPGVTEAEVAGQLANRLIKHGLTPLELNVAADERAAKYRRAPPSATKVRKRVWLGATAERYGLCAAAGRQVAFGRPDAEFAKDFEHASMAAAAAIYYSQAGVPLQKVLDRMHRTYRRRGREADFFLADPGAVLGYTPCDMPVRPGAAFRFGDPNAVVWRPTVGAAQSADTILVDTLGYEIVTNVRRWPMIQIEVSGHRVERPDVLVR